MTEQMKNEARRYLPQNPVWSSFMDQVLSSIFIENYCMSGPVLGTEDIAGNRQPTPTFLTLTL